MKSSTSTPLLARYTKHSRNIIIIYLLSFMTLLAVASILIILFLNLLPSIKLGKEFIPIDCYVNKHLINMTIQSYDYDCADLDSQIWWYHILGQNAFYHHVVSHGDSDYYDHRPKPTIFSTIHQDSQQHQNFNFFNNAINNNGTNNNTNTTSSDSGSSNSSSSSSSSDSSSDQTICYQGLYEVSYVIDNQTYSSNISGTWNTNFKWVLGYLSAFKSNETSSCVYQKDHYQRVNWFGADKFSVTSVILMTLCVLFIIALVIINSIFIKNRNVKKHHLLPSYPVYISSSFTDS
ncbi:hypothetical protein DFA_09397 [Cavenderia fasciculata]|uniref:Transmembrane protein n=1 Tax=Cavenderia fasciculata TaxID=261658 RepID=F4Q7I4_CACFS|nr:uncharacterized protein DFA_09397 [Cavenderia fasciculata]EGG16366.1 hypothetical protein DFA_09397 [Cavenderia fasciculata]|eukprot:XP_004354750.1 hypothetical protein DFA_09397 [Cavenderia fasciculata]